VTLRPGAAVQIFYVDADSDSAALTTLYADRDGDLDTEADQVVIATDLSENDGASQQFSWGTGGVAPGTYNLIGVIDDGSHAPVQSVAAGLVTLNAGPTLDFVTPQADVYLLFGELVDVTYRDTDPDDVATTSLYADGDGDLGTDSDQYAIAIDVAENDGAANTVSWDTSGVPAGRYSLIAVCRDALGESAAVVSTVEVELAVVVPAPDAFVTGTPSRIAVQLGTDAAAASVDAATFRVLRSGGDGTFHDGNEVAIEAVSVLHPVADTYVFDFGGQTLPPDVYQVVLAGRGAGGALDLDGADDYARIPNAAEFQPGLGSWTAECWVSLDVVTGINGLLVCANGDFDNGWMLGQESIAPIAADGVFYSLFESNLLGETPRDSHALYGDEAVLVASWDHVAATYDHSTGMARLYVNGILVTESGPRVLSPMDPVNDLKLGTYGQTSASINWYTDGRLDEVRIWNVARSVNEIRRDLYRTLTGSEPGLAGYWTLDAASGQSVVDSTANANHGFLGTDGNAATDDPIRVSSNAWPIVRDSAGDPLDLNLDGKAPAGAVTPDGDLVWTFRIQ